MVANSLRYLRISGQLSSYNTRNVHDKLLEMCKYLSEFATKVETIPHDVYHGPMWLSSIHGKPRVGIFHATVPFRKSVDFILTLCRCAQCMPAKSSPLVVNMSDLFDTADFLSANCSQLLFTVAVAAVRDGHTSRRFSFCKYMYRYRYLYCKEKTNVMVGTYGTYWLVPYLPLRNNGVRWIHGLICSFNLLAMIRFRIVPAYL